MHKVLFFSCSTVRFVGSQSPEQGMNPGPWQGKHTVLTTGPPGNSQGASHNTNDKIKSITKLHRLNLLRMAEGSFL